jgi:hypothetical protein
MKTAKMNRNITASRKVVIAAGMTFFSWMLMVVGMNWATANDLMSSDVMVGMGLVSGLLLAPVMTLLGYAYEDLTLSKVQQ